MRPDSNVFGTLFRKTVRRLGLGASSSRSAEADLDVLSALDDPFRARLLSMYRQEPQLGADGQMHPIDNLTRISPTQGLWLYNLCLSTKSQTTLEIGMAYGYSTLFFLAAGIGQHVAIDPFQMSHWHGIGLTHARVVAPESRFQFIEDRSDRAAADLARSGRSFGVIFIDGNHRFDDVLVDFSLYAPLCGMSGHIVLDDLWMSSVQTACSFIRTNRPDFTEIYTPHDNICVFQKISEDVREWRHFRKFPVSEDQS